MAQNFIIYNTTSGRITSSALIDDQYYTIANAELNAAVGEVAMIANIDVLPTTHRVDVSGTPTVVARVDLDTICSLTNSGGTWTADGVDTIVYGSALPNPTAYNIGYGPQLMQNTTGTITDGTLTLTTTKPGDYTITLTAFPYLDKVITITAV